VRQDDSRGITRQRLFDHRACGHRGLRHRAAEHLLQLDDPVLCIQEQHAEHLVLQHPDLQEQVVLHRLRRRHRGAAPNAMRQDAPRLRQHLLGTRRAGLPETEAPRRSAAVRVRRRPQAANARLSERADLDGENDVVAWDDTASPASARQRQPDGECRYRRPECVAGSKSGPETPGPRPQRLLLARRRRHPRHDLEAIPLLNHRQDRATRNMAVQMLAFRCWRKNADSS
jgi:hypothetical protein